MAGLNSGEFLYGTELAEGIRSISRKSQSRLWIASPYVGATPQRLLSKRLKHIHDARFVVDFSTRAVASGATNPYGVKSLMRIARVQRLDNLHAKLYISDSEAILTSANLSARAFGAGSLEVGMRIRDKTLVDAISKFFESEIHFNSEIIDEAMLKSRLETWRRSHRLRAALSGRETREKRIFWRPSRPRGIRTKPVGTELVMDILEETRKTQVQIPVRAMMQFSVLDQMRKPMLL